MKGTDMNPVDEEALIDALHDYLAKPNRWGADDNATRAAETDAFFAGVHWAAEYVAKRMRENAG